MEFRLECRKGSLVSIVDGKNKRSFFTVDGSGVIFSESFKKIKEGDVIKLVIPEKIVNRV